MLAQLARLPRIKLINLPTPLQEANNLRKIVDGPRIFLKRDDETGFALGGNKARKLEYIMADAVAKNADVVIAFGSIGSNCARLVAASARKLGMDVVLVLCGEKPETLQGNVFLDLIFGADVRLIDEHPLKFLMRNSNKPTLVEGMLNSIAEEKRAEGYTPYIVPGGGFCPLGIAAYMNAAAELVTQAASMGFTIDNVVVAAGSGGTYAGLALGMKALFSGTRVIGIDMSKIRSLEALIDRIVTGANDTARTLDVPVELEPGDVELYDYAGEGYPIPSPEAYDAIRTLANYEGVLLDPIYTAKAMAGLIDLVRRGRFGKHETVIFVHTGGIPALFSDPHLLRNLGVGQPSILQG